MGLFDGMFGPPLSPEEQAAEDRRRAEQRLAFCKKMEAGLPHLKEAQMALREAVACGIDSSYVEDAQRNLAIAIEATETNLVRP